MKHWSECIDIWHGSSLGQWDSSFCSNEVPRDMYGLTPGA